MNGADVERKLQEDEISEDSTALLPRHTKVLVTGNNRTKTKLVGLKGVVKKAVGLGGWHWLVLSDGSHVRLQRNALTVLEQPTGEESDSEDPEDQSPATGGPSGEERTTFAPPVAGGTRKRKHSRYAASSLRRKQNQDSGAPDIAVNFNKLEAAALKRYRRHYKLQVQANATKDQLVTAVGSHFMKQKVDERKVIHTFLESMIAKRLKSK